MDSRSGEMRRFLAEDADDVFSPVIGRPSVTKTTVLSRLFAMSMLAGAWLFVILTLPFSLVFCLKVVHEYKRVVSLILSLRHMTSFA